MNKYIFSSTQVNLPLPLSSEIARWGMRYIPDNDLFIDPNDTHFGRENEVHVSICYGLHSDRPNEVRNLLSGVDCFEIELGKISLFNWSDRFDVIKIEAFSDELHRLNKLLSRLPCTQIFPLYKPHVTIAYVQKYTCEKYVNNMDFAGKIWMPRTVIFSSRGGIKTPIPLKFKPSQQR